MTILASHPEVLSSEGATAEACCAESEVPGADESYRESELDLYDPMLKEVDLNWSQDEGYDSCITRKTALAGRRQTGGKWTRPDICMVGIRKFKFLRDPIFDVISFEIKPAWAVTVEGVFEALAHRQFATRSYVIFHIDSAHFMLRPEASRIVALAEQHGVGIILAQDSSNYDTWVEKVYGRRWSPDPVDLNDFIQRIFPLTDHDQIIKFTK